MTSDKKNHAAKPEQVNHGPVNEESEASAKGVVHSAEPIIVAPGTASESYRVGRGRPPLHSRFPPGVSGNPKGRPKNCKNEKTLLIELLDQPKVSLREGGRLRKITLREVILRRITEKAAKGDLKSAEFLFSRYAAVVAADSAQVPLTDDDRKVIETFLKKAQAESNDSNK